MGQQQDKADRNVDSLEALAEGRAGDADEEIAPVGPADNGGAAMAELASVGVGQTDHAAAVQAGEDTGADFGYRFRRTMIPLLLVAALLLLGLVGMIVAAGRSDGMAEKLGLVLDEGHGSRAVWFCVACSLVGVLLLLGAWIFHRDLRRADKK